MGASPTFNVPRLSETATPTKFYSPEAAGTLRVPSAARRIDLMSTKALRVVDLIGFDIPRISLREQFPAFFAAYPSLTHRVTIKSTNR